MKFRMTFPETGASIDDGEFLTVIALSIFHFHSTFSRLTQIKKLFSLLVAKQTNKKKKKMEKNSLQMNSFVYKMIFIL